MAHHSPAPKIRSISGSRTSAHTDRIARACAPLFPFRLLPLLGGRGHVMSAKNTWTYVIQYMTQMVGRGLFKTIEPLLCIRYCIPLASVDIICTFVLCSVDTVTNWACHQCRALSNAEQQYHIKEYSDIDNSLSLLYNVRKSLA